VNARPDAVATNAVGRIGTTQFHHAYQNAVWSFPCQSKGNSVLQIDADQRYDDKQPKSPCDTMRCSAAWLLYIHVPAYLAHSIRQPIHLSPLLFITSS
jgi:hypothetical protein